jgi:hypothetical protein
MKTTLSDGDQIHTLYGARPYLPSRDRSGASENSLQSSCIAIIQIEDSIEVWELQDVDTMQDLLRWLADTDHEVVAWSVADLLPAFRPINS